MKVLFLGDVVGKAGCQHVARHLGGLKRSLGVDACIANGENSAEGNGITPESARMLFDAGVDVITTGNHVYKRREVYDLLDEGEGIVRPGNLHPTAPGKGWYLLDRLRWQLCVINVMGQVYMEPCSNPFEYLDQLLPQIKTPNIIVDFHGEATSEKKALGYYLDGRVSAVLGTHTHVATADERVLPGGTGYITDAGMCGGQDSVLGVKKELIVRRFIDHMPVRFEYDPENCVMDAVFLEIDEKMGKTTKIERITV